MLNHPRTIPCKVTGGDAAPSTGRGGTEEGGLAKGQTGAMVGRILLDHNNHPG